MLRNQGDIWLISTKHNPCRLVDIWNSGELTRENVSKLCIFEGEFLKWMHPVEYEKNPGYTCILGATETGQVLVFENDGFIASRTQVTDRIIDIGRFTRMQLLIFLHTLYIKLL